MSPQSDNAGKELADDVANDVLHLTEDAGDAARPLLWTQCQRCRAPYRAARYSVELLCGACLGRTAGCCDGGPLD